MNEEDELPITRFIATKLQASTFSDEQASRAIENWLIYTFSTSSEYVTITRLMSSE